MANQNTYTKYRTIQNPPKTSEVNGKSSWRKCKPVCSNDIHGECTTRSRMHRQQLSKHETEVLTQHENMNESKDPNVLFPGGNRSRNQNFIIKKKDNNNNKHTITRTDIET